MKIWTCKIGECEAGEWLRGSDKPMRIAIAKAYEEVTGKKPNFIFSSWAEDLTEAERQVLKSNKEEGAQAAY